MPKPLTTLALHGTNQEIAAVVVLRIKPFILGICLLQIYI